MRKSTPFNRPAQTPAHSRRATRQRQDALCLCVCKAVAEVVIVYSQSLTPYFAHAKGGWGGRECREQKSGKDSGGWRRGVRPYHRPLCPGPWIAVHWWHSTIAALSFERPCETLLASQFALYHPQCHLWVSYPLLSVLNWTAWRLLE